MRADLASDAKRGRWTHLMRLKLQRTITDIALSRALQQR